MLRGIIITIFQPSRVSTLTIWLEWEVWLQESDLSSTNKGNNVHNVAGFVSLTTRNCTIFKTDKWAWCKHIRRNTYHVSVCNHMRRKAYHLIIMLYVIVSRERHSCLISSKKSLASLTLPALPRESIQRLKETTSGTMPFCFICRKTWYTSLIFPSLT